MVESVFKFTQADDKAIEKLVFDENLNYIHVVLPPGDGFPEHFSNANVYLTILRGVISITLGEQKAVDYKGGTLLKIPEGTKMLMQNQSNKPLELIIVKAPAPKN